MGRNGGTPFLPAMFPRSISTWDRSAAGTGQPGPARRSRGNRRGRAGRSRGRARSSGLYPERHPAWLFRKIQGTHRAIPGTTADRRQGDDWEIRLGLAVRRHLPGEGLAFFRLGGEVAPGLLKLPLKMGRGAFLRPSPGEDVPGGVEVGAQAPNLPELQPRGLYPDAAGRAIEIVLLELGGLLGRQAARHVAFSHITGVDCLMVHTVRLSHPYLPREGSPPILPTIFCAPAKNRCLFSDRSQSSRSRSRAWNRTLLKRSGSISKSAQISSLLSSER